MINLGTPALKIFLALEPCDMRKSFNGLTELATNRRTKADRFPKNLKILIGKIITPQEVLANPDDWKLIGQEHTDELDVIKAEIFWRHTVHEKYVHNTDKSLAPPHRTRPLPRIPGTIIALALAAQIICDKYQDHLPHYHQSQRFRRRHDIDIRCQTLNTWTHANARHLAPIDQAIRAEILESEKLQIDETPIDYLDPGHDIPHGTCYFAWHTSRATHSLLRFLGYDEQTNTIAYQGNNQTDGYIVYQTVAAQHGIRHAGCLTHARRKFTDLGNACPEVTLPILLHIQRIYHIAKQTRQTGAPRQP